MRASFVVTALSAFIVVPAIPAAGQDGDTCFLFCRPGLKIEPTFTVENLFNRHRIAQMSGDTQVVVEQAEREVVFETILALDIPTEIPRVGFTLETIFIPFADGSENPFTGQTAQDLGLSSIRDNSPESRSS
jgi:hypothetical protein